MLAVLLGWWGPFPGGASGGTPDRVDLARSVVVAPGKLSGPEGKALALLTDEVHKRTLVRWEVAHAWPADSVPVIAVGPASLLQQFAGPYARKLASRPGPRGKEGFRLLLKRA